MAVSSSSPLSFRPAEPGDIPALHALIERAYRGESARLGWTHEADLIASPRTSADELAGIISSPDDRLIGAWRGAAPVGCVRLSRQAPDGAYLGMLTVDPALQGGGLGDAILRHAEAQAPALFGARTMVMWVVSVRGELIAYYRRRGYAPTGERRPFPVALDPPLEFVVMRKAL